MFLYKEKTETYHSCSLTWQGKLYVFGGDKEKRQISVLNGCTLERISYLNSDHYWGACTNMNDQIYLCFNMGPTEDYKKCRVSSSPESEFMEIPESNFYHAQTRIGSSQGKAAL